MVPDFSQRLSSLLPQLLPEAHPNSSSVYVYHPLIICLPLIRRHPRLSLMASSMHMKARVYSRVLTHDPLGNSASRMACERTTLLSGSTAATSVPESLRVYGSSGSLFSSSLYCRHILLRTKYHPVEALNTFSVLVSLPVMASHILVVIHYR